MINSFKDLAALIQGCKGDASQIDWHQYGQVNVKQSDDLILFSYMATCQFKKPEEWNWFEKVSRGLVMNVKGEVVARPFDKFWNYGEVLPTGKIVEVTDKADGSLIIVFAHKGEIRAVTRGSFDSEQAQWASQYIKDHLDLRFLLADTNITLLFEAIYPENQIVVDYKGREDLVLLGVRNTRGGGDWWRCSVKLLADSYGLSLLNTFEVTSADELLERAKTLGPEHEGWVVRYEDGTRVKIKGSTYLELHRWLSLFGTGRSKKAVAKAIAEGKLEELKKSCPEILQEALKQSIFQVDLLVGGLWIEVYDLWETAPVQGTRKDFAMWVKEQDKSIQKFLFLYYDKKLTDGIIAKYISELY